VIVIWKIKLKRSTRPDARSVAQSISCKGLGSSLRNTLTFRDGYYEPGRHCQLGKIGDYLEIVSQSEELSPLPDIEPRRSGEYEVSELPSDLEHVVFGVFKNKDGIWDYRFGSRVERLYSLCQEK
jgi:hypothetical protein